MTQHDPGERVCRRHIPDLGYVGRGPLVIAREEGLFTAFASLLTDSDADPDSEPDGDPDSEAPLTMQTLEDAFGDNDDVVAFNAACFLAGRCEPDEAADSARLTSLVANIVAPGDPARLRSDAVAYVEAAMSLVLRGESDAGHTALRAVGSGDGANSMADWLAAGYLAELGDPSGYGLVVRLIEKSDPLTRLQAARHIALFLPFDGQTVGGEVVDVRGRLADRLDDDPAGLVSAEIPSLLAEIGGDRVRELLVRAAATARHDDTRRAAARALDHLDS